MSSESETHSLPGETATRAQGKGWLGDLRSSLRRWLLKTSRTPFVTFYSLVQPVIFFVLMAEVFGAVAGSSLSAAVRSDVHYVTFLAPAIIIQSALASAAVSGIGLVDDLETGMFEKTLVSPMDRSAMFLGKLLSELVRIAVQTLIVLAFGYGLLVLKGEAAVGRYVATGIGGVFGVLLLALLFGTVFMAYSNIVALVTRDREATIMLANLLTFPLLFLSSAFLPLAALPGWVQTVAAYNPITYGVDGIRALMLGEDVMTVLDVTAFSGLWNTVVPAVGVLLAFTVVLGAVAVRLLHRAARADVQ